MYYTANGKHVYEIDIGSFLLNSLFLFIGHVKNLIIDIKSKLFKICKPNKPHSLHNASHFIPLCVSAAFSGHYTWPQSGNLYIIIGVLHTCTMLHILVK